MANQAHRPFNQYSPASPGTLAANPFLTVTGAANHLKLAFTTIQMPSATESSARGSSSRFLKSQHILNRNFRDRIVKAFVLVAYVTPRGYLYAFCGSPQTFWTEAGDDLADGGLE